MYREVLETAWGHNTIFKEVYEHGKLTCGIYEDEVLPSALEESSLEGRTEDQHEWQRLCLLLVEQDGRQLACLQLADR